VLLLAAGGRGGNAQSLTTASPRIFFVESPALLILIDGDPEYRAVEGTQLERIVNTRALIVRDDAGLHYLKVLDGWMEAYTLNGDWSVSGVTPTGGREALERAVDEGTINLLDRTGSQAEAPSLTTQAPTVVISSEPAALIVTDGPARYRRVEGTSLEYLCPGRRTLVSRLGDRWFLGVHSQR
jgi:hypothetical protein